MKTGTRYIRSCLLYLVASLICFSIKATDKPCTIPSLQELALQRVVSILQSKETMEQYVHDPKAFEEQVTSCGMHTGAIKDLIVGQLLKSYEGDISCCKKLVKPAQSIFGSSNQALSVRWHPKKDILAASYSNGKIRIWDGNTDQLLQEMRENREDIDSLDWHPTCDDILASGSDDCTIIIWNANTGEKLKRLIGHRNRVCLVCWHPTNNNILASGSDDGRVRIWNAKTGESLWVFYQDNRFFHQGRTYFATDRILSLSWCKQGRLLACGSAHGTLHILDEQAQPSKHYTGSDWVISIDCSPDGAYVAAGYSDGKIILWCEHEDNVASYDHPAEVIQYEGNTRDIEWFCWYPGGELVTSTVEGGTVYIWNLKTGKVVKKFDNKARFFSSPSWHPQGRFLAAASECNAIRIWDMQAYDNAVEQTSLMQALFMLYRTKHEEMIFPKGESSDKGKEEDVSVEDADIAHTWEAQRYMRILEASLPYPLKDILKKK